MAGQLSPMSRKFKSLGWVISVDESLKVFAGKDSFTYQFDDAIFYISEEICDMAIKEISKDVHNDFFLQEERYEAIQVFIEDVNGIYLLGNNGMELT